MMYIKYLFLCAIILVWSCSPKVVVVEPDKVESDTVSTGKQVPKSPCTTLAEIPGYDRERAETAFVLYKDFLKTKNYNEAYLQWKLAYTLAPGSNGKVKSHFEDGANIYKYFYEQTSDTLLKRKYVDTIMMIYDKKKECFGDEAYINGIKAFDYYYYFPQYTTVENIYQLFKSNVDVKGKNADYFVINPFSKLLFDMVVENKVSITDGRKYAELIFSAVENGKATCKGKACEAWDIISEYAPVLLENLEGIDDFYDCAYYTKKYYALYKANPDSCEIINLAYSRMLRGDCPVADSKLTEIRNAKNIKCYVAPPALSCAAQGYEYYNQGKYNKAIEAYQTCINQSNDAELKARYLMTIAKIYYRDLQNYPKARTAALEAAKWKPASGEPYLLIGNLYASSGPLCGPGRGWDSQIVTWPAIDMWTKAKNIDNKVAAEANGLINRYRQYMPKKEDLFFRNLKEGDRYFVPCWIQESTVIRSAD